jgi:transcriptional regulator
MYVPPSFARTDPAELFAFMEAYSFAVLASTRDGEPFATHLPLLLDRGGGPRGTLLGHMARANPQWHGLDGRPVLAVFAGPHAYVSPAWYESADAVPTWNYVAVHATGTFRLVDDPDAVTEIVSATVETYERNRPAPWKLDASAEYVHKLVGGVVGFRIAVERLEGKWKLSQNQSAARRASVAAALESSADADGRAIARLMRATDESPSGA